MGVVVVVVGGGVLGVGGGAMGVVEKRRHLGATASGVWVGGGGSEHDGVGLRGGGGQELEVKVGWGGQ